MEELEHYAEAFHHQPGRCFRFVAGNDPRRQGQQLPRLAGRGQAEPQQSEAQGDHVKDVPTGKWMRAGGGHQPASGLTCPGGGAGQRQPQSRRGPSGAFCSQASMAYDGPCCDLPSGANSSVLSVGRAR
jgi:hypothetical protein